MRLTAPSRVAAMVAMGVLVATGLRAQESPVRAHILLVADAFEGTPNGQGLLTTAVAEAEIASAHAAFAGEDRTSLEGMKRHALHVIHAIDPTLALGGPGLGYGVRAAASDAARHLELAAADSTASSNVKAHAMHISSAAGNVVQLADEIVAVAQEIQGATSSVTAAGLLEQLKGLTGELVSGRDADGDGRIGWQAGEGGLRQATQHMTLLKRGEGLGY